MKASGSAPKVAPAFEALDIECVLSNKFTLSLVEVVLGVWGVYFRLLLCCFWLQMGDCVRVQADK